MLPGLESGDGQDTANASIAALYPTLGLGVAEFDEAVLVGDGGGAGLFEGMIASGRTLAGGTKAVGELLAVVNEQLGDLEWGPREQALEELLGSRVGLLREDRPNG
ncbi:MAG: hypothetical protein WAT23_02300 [Chromatiaceae bacterium]